jgi:hypothetical protein
MRQEGHVACMREKKNTYRVMMRKSEGKRSLATSRYKWQDNNKMLLRERGWGVLRTGFSWLGIGACDEPYVTRY